MSDRGTNARRTPGSNDRPATIAVGRRWAGVPIRDRGDVGGATFELARKGLEDPTGREGSVVRSGAETPPRDRAPSRTRSTVGASAIAVLATGILATTALGTAAAASCPDVDALPTAIGIARSTAAVGCLVDHERTAAGLGPLGVDGRIRRAAQDYAVDMALRGFFAHESPEGTDPGSRLLAAGFGWSAYGENIAAGQQTPRAVVADWLASPGHCRNLMTPMFTVAGYGVATADDGPYWVHDFGRPLTSGVLASTRPAPACPRVPTPLGATTAAAVPVSPVDDAAATTTSGVPASPSASARRSGRRLRVVVALPAAGGSAAGAGTGAGAGSTAGGGSGAGAGSTAGGGSGAGARSAAGGGSAAGSAARARSAAGGSTSVTVRVRQAGRTVRASTMRRPAGTTLRMTVRLPQARGGRVLVRAGGGRTAGVSFR